MGLFKIFKKSETTKIPKGYNEIRIKYLKHLTAESVQVTLEIPMEMEENFEFIPGQHLDFAIVIDGEIHRRSYSICSGPNEPLSVAVKAINKGLVSNWFKTEAKAGQIIWCTFPSGHFIRTPEMKKMVAFAAGSGITPVLAIAKSLKQDEEMHLFYGNQTVDSTLYWDEIPHLPGVNSKLYLSREEREGAVKGRLDEDNISDIIKADLSLLKADAFFLCGPNEMIETISKKLELFGVDKSKIKRELFTSPVATSNESVDSDGQPVAAKVKVILDGEEIFVDYTPKGKTILELLDVEGYDPPYSCRGGVCSTCRATVTEGTAKMRMNYVLTDEEIQNGSILCCQAEPTSSKVTISFDA
jgi:ring-1,2-phenylacetyl-CoA epoxidase subunit PaaE